MDLMPTFLKLAGLDLSDVNNPYALDGREFTPVLFAETEQPAREPVFWRKGDQAAARSGYWKLVRIKDQSLALYNLEDDPGESNDLASLNPQLLKEMLRGLESWEKDVDLSFANLAR